MVLEILKSLGITDPKYIPNAISGLFSFAGILLTGVAAILAWWIKQQLLRREKKNDLRHALLADIEVQWKALRAGPAHGPLLAEIEKRLTAPDGETYSPHFTRYLESEIFKEVKSQITALGKEEIPHIVRFFHHMAVMDCFVTELRNEEFKNFTAERKIEMIKHLFRMIDTAIDLAETAITSLENELRLPAHKRLPYR